MGPTPPQSEHGQPTRHACHCGKSFLRKEHLRRHQATHTKPSFSCPICNRSFTRNDVLKRHITVHDSTHVSSSRNWKACDACHENKTKCDGGDQCTLCLKRGVSCTYTRDNTTKDVVDTDQSNVYVSPRTSPVQVDSSAEPMLIEPTLVSARGPTEQEILDLQIQAARQNLYCVKGAVDALITGNSTISRPAAKSSIALQWLPSRVKHYFGRFHDRWPTLHAPVFDPKTDDALLVGSVLIKASWQCDHESVRDVIVSIHDQLVSHLLKTIMEEDPATDDRWPFETYQVALLNIVFAFESGRTSLIPRARRLLSALVSSLREKRIFNPEVVDAHENKHAPGTFRPWVYHNRAKWKWLVLCLVKIDTYLALLYHQPPLINVEELELNLQSTFALANAYGINVFFSREPQEPFDRAKCPMVSIARSPHTVLSSGTLAEDIMLGLCGTYPGIWRWGQTVKMSPLGPRADCDSGANVTRSLDAWKIRLDNVSNLWTEPETNLGAITYLLQAYRGEEEETQPNWESPVLTRIAVHILNAAFFYHLLGIHMNVHGDFEAISLVHPIPTVDLKPDRLRQWAISKEGRTAMLHSLSILKSYENALATMDSPSQAMDPIANVALATASLVFRNIFLADVVTCECHQQRVRELDLNNSFEKDQWVHTGGVVSVDGLALCCSSDTWMARFGTALAQGGKLWEMSSSVMSLLTLPGHVE